MRRTILPGIQVDTPGFGPYVECVAQFLESLAIQPPL
jgi:hypothetical protein